MSLDFDFETCASKASRSSTSHHRGSHVADSKPVFQSRAAEIGLSADDVQKLTAAEMTSMALFAFSCNNAPGNSDDKPLMPGEQ